MPPAAASTATSSRPSSRGPVDQQIAGRLGVSYATVRDWLEKYGLRTDGRVGATRCRVAGRGERWRGDRDLPAARGDPVRKRHGGGWRCLRCRAEAVTARRRAVKAALVAEAEVGASSGVLEKPRRAAIHHREPQQKSFRIAHRGVARSLTAARAEASKCVLLCANCHAEVEAGLATIRDAPADNPGWLGPG